MNNTFEDYLCNGGGIKTRDTLVQFNSLYSHDIPSPGDSWETMSLHDLSTEV